MIFVIDSGSTKCDWIAIDSSTGEPIFDKQRTRGLNPAIISSTDAFDIIMEINYQYLKFIFTALDVVLKSQ
jgi:hypothetical protein